MSASLTTGADSASELGTLRTDGAPAKTNAVDWKLEQLAPENLEEVITFLRETFRAPSDAAFLRPEQLRWQFFEPRPDWEGSRSYVLRAEGRIVAHGCVVPNRFVTPEGAVIRSMAVTNWAADPSFPGTGLLLLQELGELADVRLGFRGSAIARAMVRKAYSGRKSAHDRIAGEVITARRTFRPWISACNTPSWKTLARMGREVWRNTRRPLKSAGDWTALPVKQFDGLLPDLRPRRRTPDLILPLRTPELLNYMLRCPSVRFSGYFVRKGGEDRGHLLLGDLGEEIRLADLVLNSDDTEDWEACYRLAVTTAKRYYPRAAHLVAIAAPPSLQRVLLQAGYTTIQRRPLTVRDNRYILPPDHVFVLNMMDSDAAYLR